MAPGTAAPPPLIYQLFFLYIEPVATALGAYYAYYRPTEYMQLTLSYPSAPLIPVLGVSTAESIVLTQLANLYLVFAINEAIVLRATNDRRVWVAFLLGLLIADFGHLLSVAEMGWDIYFSFWKWNAIYWGNLAFVYAGASMRIAFLLGLGISESGSKAKAKA